MPVRILEDNKKDLKELEKEFPKEASIIEEMLEAAKEEDASEAETTDENKEAVDA